MRIYVDSGSQLTSFDSGSVGLVACCGWTLPVCLSCWLIDNHNISIISSWEFVTTLDYEWSVIRGQRPFRWTIWVSIDVLFLPRSGGAELVCPVLTDLHPDTHIHPYHYNTYPGGNRRYSSIQL